jgi:hypothetical protein
MSGPTKQVFIPPGAPKSAGTPRKESRVKRAPERIAVTSSATAYDSVPTLGSSDRPLAASEDSAQYMCPSEDSVNSPVSSRHT